jgi:hypothetical protein
MYDVILRKYGYIGIYTIAKQITESCLTCRKVNKQVSRKQLLGGRSPGLRPFQSVQVHYAKMPKIGQLRYLLNIVDHLANWVEVTPILLSSATAHNVAKVLLESIILRFGLIENTDSDSGSHFMATSSKILLKPWICLGNITLPGTLHPLEG